MVSAQAIPAQATVTRNAAAAAVVLTTFGALVSDLAAYDLTALPEDYLVVPGSTTLLSVAEAFGRAEGCAHTACEQLGGLLVSVEGRRPSHLPQHVSVSDPTSGRRLVEVTDWCATGRQDALLLAVDRATELLGESTTEH